MTPHVQVAVTAESGRTWVRRIAGLAFSLNRRVPSLLQSGLVAHVVDPGPDVPRTALRALGVRVVPTTAVRDRSPLNKIRMFEAAEPSATLLALDCDVIVDDDLTPALESDALCGVPAEFPLLRRDVWTALYADLGLPLLEQPITSVVSGECLPVPYLNSGVIAVPGRWAASLADAWLQFAATVDRHPLLLPWRAAYEFHLEQIALACAVSALGLPLRVLPVEFNVPFRLPDVPRVRVLHYHSRMRADGTLERPPGAVPAATVYRFNRDLRACGLASESWPFPEPAAAGDERVTAT